MDSHQTEGQKFESTQNPNPIIEGVPAVIPPKQEQATEPTEIERIHAIVAYATSANPGTKPALYKMRKIGKDEAQRLKTATSLNLKGYEHAIDPDGVRHIYKKHCLRATVSEVAISAADLYLITDIIDNADSVERSNKSTDRGHMAIKYVKTIGGDIYTYIAEVVFKDRIIQTKTMYKNRLP